MTTFTATIDNVQRMANTQNGNPKYLITSGGRNWVTAPDKQFLHSIMPDLIKGETVRITLDDNNQISDLEELITWDTHEALAMIDNTESLYFLTRGMSQTELAQLISDNAEAWELDMDEVDVEYIFNATHDG